MSTVTDLSTEDPVAPAGLQFALTGASFTPRPEDEPSPDDVRPWGLRHAVHIPVPDIRMPRWTYDGLRQLAVDESGRPMIETLPTMGPPTSKTSPPVDGDTPGAEDWNND